MDHYWTRRVIVWFIYLQYPVLPPEKVWLASKWLYFMLVLALVLAKSLWARFHTESCFDQCISLAAFKTGNRASREYTVSSYSWSFGQYDYNFVKTLWYSSWDVNSFGCLHHVVLKKLPQPSAYLPVYLPFLSSFLTSLPFQHQYWKLSPRLVDYFIFALHTWFMS